MCFRGRKQTLTRTGALGAAASRILALELGAAILENAASHHAHAPIVRGALDFQPHLLARHTLTPCGSQCMATTTAKRPARVVQSWGRRHAWQ